MKKAVYTLTISIEPEEPVVGETCKIKGTLTKDGEPIPDAKVKVYIFKGTEEEAELETTTDENGEYEVEYTFTEPTYRTIYSEAEFEEKPVKPPVPTIPTELAVAGVIALGTALGLIIMKKKRRPG